ncbi:MAG: hypothetical protein HY678_10475 [Chloroflexi bacterium]|nr:hypothetical protein [Chloroflexota bacterium]
MTTRTAQQRLHVKDIVRRYGRCLELIGMDTHFHDISVGLYVKNGIFSVWTFSREAGADQRISEIRDLIWRYGDLSPVPGTSHQARYACGQAHEQAMKFVMMETVERNPVRELGTGPLVLRDTKTKMTLRVEPKDDGGRAAYVVSGEGEGSEAPEMRLRAVVGGFMRYGGAQRVAPTQFAFSCGARHDNLVRVLLPYARNVSTVEELLESESLRGQMTTQTLGFSSSV